MCSFFFFLGLFLLGSRLQLTKLIRILSSIFCRDLAEFRMDLNSGPPAMSREEFEARKADVRRRREHERRAER